jgi:hypothetical protein
MCEIDPCRRPRPAEQDFYVCGVRMDRAEVLFRLSSFLSAGF